MRMFFKFKDAEEFSVRVSYVELYNEELYDLLGNAELGHARLRLFEDSVRKVNFACYQLNVYQTLGNW